MFFIISFCTKCKKEQCQFGDSTVKLIGSRNSPAKYYLDIDNDGHSDFEFCSDFTMSLGGVGYQESSIRILNSEIEISVREQSDTIHICNEVFFNQQLNITSNRVTTFNNQSTFSCPEANTDSVTNINKGYYPQVHKEGESMDSLITWRKENLIFSSYNSSVYSYPITIDSVYVENYSIARGLWNNTSLKYLLFRIRISENYSYGWVQISIHDYKEIWLHNYAIQKNAFCL